MKDRKTHWEEIYQHKSAADVSWFQQQPEPSLTLIRNTHVRHDEPIIDVGGGASVLVDALIAEQYTSLAVLDIASAALVNTQQRLGSKARDIEWFESDITEFESLHPFTVWHDRAVFHFLVNPADRRRYVETLKRTLSSGGHLIMAAFAIGGPDKCSGLDIVQYDAEKLLGELGDEFVLRQEVKDIHVTPAGKEQKFNYFRLQRQ